MISAAAAQAAGGSLVAGGRPQVEQARQRTP